MLKLTWVTAGPAYVCKTLREGFDSLPRLHFFHELWRIWKGISIYRIGLYRNCDRFPTDYSKKKLFELVVYHCEEHIKAKTELSNTRERLIETQKELSFLKRRKEKERKEVVVIDHATSKK